MADETSAPRHVLHLDSMPFLLSVGDRPTNGFAPDFLPFDLELDLRTGRLAQRAQSETIRQLDLAYQRGSLLGTAMDDTPSGRGYADELMAFLLACRPELAAKCVLEIGAGRGYFVRLLNERGADAVGIEPGIQNEPHWRRHGVRMLPYSFPHESATGPYDIIVAFAVLEHLPTAAGFIDAVKSRLRPGGCLVAAVPNCAPQIAAGDPSMLLHEHFSYFTASTFKRELEGHGLSVSALETSPSGGVLYACASVPADAPRVEPATRAEVAEALAYGERCNAFSSRLLDELKAAGRSRTLGIYCPGRAINVLPSGIACRFFDDDQSLTGKYYPGIPVAIEPRSGLLADPVNELWIMSRSYGAKIADELARAPSLAGTRIRLISELM